jgi:hypothetical protein
MENFHIVLIPLAVGVITQITKFVIFSLKNGLDWSYFFTHGHMPSFHSAIVTSLVTTIGFIEGIGTGVFSLAAVFALIILDDALRVRMYLGDQGRYLNMLTESLELDKKKYPRLKEHVGHRFSEVVAGIIYGLVLSLALLKVFGVI